MDRDKRQLKVGFQTSAGSRALREHSNYHACTVTFNRDCEQILSFPELLFNGPRRRRMNKSRAKRPNSSITGTGPHFPTRAGGQPR